jgi:hypothetical protein
LHSFPVLVTLSTVGVSVLGAVSVLWCRSTNKPGLAAWGQRLFLAVLALLGVLGALLALQPHRGLVLLGPVIGLLVVAMLWDRQSQGIAEL